MICPYWTLWYYNPYYGIYDNEQDMIHQGFAYYIGDKFEALSCALAVNKIGRRPETLRYISPTFDLKVIESVLDVVIHVINLNKDTITFSETLCFSTEFPIENVGIKKEIYIGECCGNYYTIHKNLDYEFAMQCANLFYLYGRYQ